MPARGALPIVSATSANALLSDLRPTTLAPQALEYINLMLDELLVGIVTAAESLNLTDLRTRGVPSALSEGERGFRNPAALGALGRAAVGEAEVEIRSWYDGHPTAQKDVSGFPPSGKGRGLVANAEEARERFPTSEAVELMRVKVASLSTFADAQDSIPLSRSDAAIAAWESAGGDGSEETVAPAGLWLTAVLEHICEHILSKLSQVVARDSSIVTAAVQDLYTALCEDDAVYGFFKRMDASEQFYKSVINAAKAVPAAANHHKRASSILSAWQPSTEDEHTVKHSPAASTAAEKSAEDDFDAILRSGETMRVSLTPSRFSTFEKTSPNTSPQRKDSGRASDHLSVAPMSSSESSLLSMSTQASTTDSRVSGYRAAAGRSWSSQQTKLMPRGPTIEEKDEDDALDFHRPSVVELLKSEPRVLSPRTQARTVPAVILGSPIPQAEHVDSETDASPTLVSESAPSQRTQRSASEGGIVETEVNVNGEMFSGQRSKSDRLTMRPETRELAHFLSTTAPPPITTAPDFTRPISPPQPSSRSGRFKNIMSRMSSTRRKEPKDEDTSFKSWAERTLLPSPSVQTLRSYPDNSSLQSPTLLPPSHTRDGSTGLRSQKSHSSVGSVSTLHGQTPGGQPRAQSARNVEPPLAPTATPREMLRRASIVRKWAAQVGHGEQKLTRRKSTPLSVSSPLPENDEGSEKQSDADSLRSPGVGLGLGMGALPSIAHSDGLMTEDEFTSAREGTPEAALATLNGSIRSRPSTIYSQASAQPLRPEKPRSVTAPARQLRHERVAELQGDAVSNGAPSVHSLGTRHSASPVLERRSLPPRSPASSPRGSPRALPLPLPSNSPKASVRSLDSDQADQRLPEGYVALADLTPLRHLLDHATTARECQLLLDAILSQLGVPRSEDTDRVAAWLLGGAPMGRWSDKVARRAPPPPSEGSSASRSSRRKKLSAEATNKSLPALPEPRREKAKAEKGKDGEKGDGEVWDLTSEDGKVRPNGDANGHGTVPDEERVEEEWKPAATRVLMAA
ncbi:hypothetical protein CC85DRAFT_300310 [Cutaneotrichosporon oleaginosum]|uniref:Uncharacterized protein n=1 Tax=Cutaneotrichosporon oleaginosum TaxID=879819 RepID=A0A0J0XUN8_9TREE|nr:uncharacterized protein CC85DRAFT_300310 [Cutaneotrichosporon oleaginosum]KLT44767.1 hypothetical protein CC85DRAFT_300310 [Cutaneotrichosporon oleaginosum]